VVGHGLEAAQLATFVRARFAAGSSDPAELLALANGALFERSGSGRELVSAVCLRLRDRQLSWAIAGHLPPLHLPGLDELSLEGSTYLLGGLSRLLAPVTKLPATEIVSQVERAILDWAEKPIRDDLCLLVLKPR
jgi:hypothetical protein